MLKTGFATVALVLSLLISLHSWGQDTLTLEKSWKNLESALIYRSKIALELASKLTHSKKMDRDQLNKTMHYSVVLQLTFDSISIINKGWIQKLIIINNNLAGNLSKTLAALEKEVKLKNQAAIVSLRNRLEESEIRLRMDIGKYNAKCKQENQPDLIFRTDYPQQPPK
jgi:hypothetical protein